MNLFARILSHGFALVVVALLALGLIYRGELFPEWKLPDYLSPGQQPDAGSTGQMAAGDQAQPVTAEPAAAAAEAPADRMPPPPPPASMPEPADEAPAAEQQAISAADGGAQPQFDDTAEASAAETPAAMPQWQDEPVSPAVKSPAEPAVTGTEGVAGEPVATPVPALESEQTVPAAAMPVETGAAVATEEPATAAAHPAPAAATVTPYRLLAAAREAYWLRDYAAAEQKYQALIALDPENPDGYGELGNMYFSQGDWEKASAAYYDAGTRLTAQRMFDRARQLAEVIRGLNGAQAGDLEQQIDAAESAAP